MKILVTGAAGFIGSNLARHFRERGARVWVDAEAADAGATRRWPLSVAALAEAMSGEQPDAIIHAAGSGTVAKVAAQPVHELPANLAAYLAVLEYVQKHSPHTRVVLLSSAALYGNAPAAPQREEDHRPPVSLYGVVKAQNEQISAYYAAQHGVSATAVRLFSVYGPGLRKQLLWDAMNKFQRPDPVFFGTGRELRDWLHVSDVCRFMDSLLASPQAAPYEVFNCGGSPATTGEVLALLAAEAGASAPAFNGQSRAGDPQCLVADCSKAARVLSWKAQVPWQEGVAAYARWHAQRHAGAPGAASP